VLLAVAASMLVASIVGGAVWVTNVEPVQRGSVGYAIEDRSVDVVHHSVDALGVSGSVQTVAMRRGMTFSYRFSIKNGAAVPVTIVDLGLDRSEDEISIRPTKAKPDLFAQPGPSAGFGPFEPFVLAAGSEAGLEVEVHVPHAVCFAPHSFASIWELPLTYKIVGVTRHSLVDTGMELRLEGTSRTAC
jgi:hypothetical protein